MKKKAATPIEFSNIITPPDFVETRAYTVLLIDPEWTEVEDVAFYLKTAKEAYNVYVYRSEMDDSTWFERAVSKSQHIILNTINNDKSIIKDKMATNKTTSKRTSYYGPKNYLMNPNRIEKPIDYFINLEK